MEATQIAIPEIGVALGFDTPTPLDADLCARFLADDRQFVMRYVTRWRSCHDEPTADIDGWFYGLSKSELATILESGLAVGIVQAYRMSCELTNHNGSVVGLNAVHNCRALGIPTGATVYLDLEVNKAPIRDIVSYCNGWSEAVAPTYRCGLYVGYDEIPGSVLYHLPRFRSYWRSNMRYVKDPLPRGYAMKQGRNVTTHGITMDPNELRPDAKGDLPWLTVA